MFIHKIFVCVYVCRVGIYTAYVTYSIRQALTRSDAGLIQVPQTSFYQTRWIVIFYWYYQPIDSVVKMGVLTAQSRCRKTTTGVYLLVVKLPRNEKSSTGVVLVAEPKKRYEKKKLI